MNDNNKMLERVLLMMKYDSSKTLTENSDVVRNVFSKQLNEQNNKKKFVQTVGQKVKDAEMAIAKATAQKAANAAKNTTKNVTNVNVKIGGTPSGLSTDQIKQEVAIFTKNLRGGKSGKPTKAESEQIKQYADKLASGQIKPQNLAPVPKGASTPPPKGGGPKGGGKKGKPNPPTPNDKSILSRLGNNIKNNKGKWLVGIVGAGLTVGGIYAYLQPKVSPCLLDSLSEDEIASLGEAGTTGKISRAQVGNRLADLNGGLSFNMDSNTVTTGNGKYSGSYSCDGNAIKVSIAGADFLIGSTGGADTGTSGGGGTTGGGGGGGSRYKQCAETFPIAMYCKNSTIARVQGCIGVTQDGAFGPKTSSALVAKGVDGSSITQASVDKVCGGGQPGKQSAPGSDAEEDDAGGGNTMTIKSNAPMANDDADEA